MSWSDIVRGGPAPKKSTLNPSAPVFIPRPPCSCCGEPAEVCRRCAKLAVYQNGLCGHCFSYNLPSDSMCIGYIHASNSAEKIPFTCSSHHASKQMPWLTEENNSKNVLKEGYVEMKDILAGQRVTAEQFFDAVRCAEAEEEYDEVPCVQPKKMSAAILLRASYEVDYDRKMHWRRIRKAGGVSTPEEDAEMAAMNAYAKAVFDEMQRR